MPTDVYVQFATIIGCATAFGILLHLLKQPLVAAYLLAGVLLSFFNLLSVSSHSPLAFLPTIGIAFLLFLIGMELDMSELKVMGKPIVLASLLQMAGMTAAVAVIATLLGFGTVQAVLIGLALSFSSTIVVIKLLIERHETTSLHGKVALGILLMQDIIAVLVLMALAIYADATASSHVSWVPFIILLIKGLVLAVGIVGIAQLVINRFLRIIATNQELLFLIAISWCFLCIVAAMQLGFSLEIGSFLGGLSLAASPFRFQIAGRLKPLRDFFIAIFFVTLGQGILFSDVSQHIKLIALFTVLALVIKPLVLMVILSFLGFKRHTNFQASIAMSQVSEFSILIFYAAQSYNLVDHGLLSVIAMTTILTIFISALVINESNRLYLHVHRWLWIFEPHRKRNDAALPAELKDHVILIGAHQAGEPVIAYLREKAGGQFIVVDYNPKLVEALQKQSVNVLFGDIADPDILDQLQLPDAKLIISTIRNKKDALTLLQSAQRLKAKAVIMMAAESEEEAQALYANGAHAVLVPTQLEGLHVITVLSQHWHNLAALKAHRGSMNVSV